MIYFISDTHFGHANIVKMCERPYPDVEAMNEALITAWNERVHGDDTVYIIGDMFFRCSDPESILKRLKGKKWLIVGNHDGSWMDKVDLNHYFVSVDNYLETTDGVCTWNDDLPLSAASVEKCRANVHGSWSYSCGHKFRLLAVNSAPGTSAECRCGCE